MFAMKAAKLMFAKSFHLESNWKKDFQIAKKAFELLFPSSIKFISLLDMETNQISNFLQSWKSNDCVWICLPDRFRTWKKCFPLLVNMVNKHILYGKVHQFHILLVKCLIDTHKKELLSWIFHELFIVSRAWNWNRLGKVYESDNFI